MESLRNDSGPARVPPKLDPDGENKRLNVVVPASWAARIDEWRREQPDLPNVSEAIRRLVDAALSAERKTGRKHGR